MATETRKYVVLEGWSEVAEFRTCQEALLIQEFMESLHPRQRFDVWMKLGTVRHRFVQVNRGREVFNDDVFESVPLKFDRWEQLKSLKGGDKEHGRRKEDLPAYQGGWPGEISQGFPE